MAINTISIVQDNIVSGANLLSINNPVAFIANAFYSGQTPDYLYVDISYNGVVIKTVKAIPYKDLTGTLRQFVFLADTILKGELFADKDINPMDDVVQDVGTFIYIDNITREFIVTFRDPSGIAASVSSTIVICLASSQYDDTNGCAMVDQFTNATDTMLCAAGGVCYVYFYNSNTSNILSINAPLNVNYAVDSNADVFTDSNADKFVIL